MQYILNAYLVMLGLCSLCYLNEIILNPDLFLQFYYPEAANDPEVFPFVARSKQVLIKYLPDLDREDYYFRFCFVRPKNTVYPYGFGWSNSVYWRTPSTRIQKLSDKEYCP